MNAIEGELYSPFQKKEVIPSHEGGFAWETKLTWHRGGATVSRIRRSEGFPVKTFRELVGEVAQVTLNNRDYEMFYRGQGVDFKDSQSIYYKEKDPKTIIYPSICRPERRPDGSYKPSIRKSKVKARYDDLYKAIDMMAGGRSYQDEYYFALFQHYDILPTPLIDITQSLRAAATFALRNSPTGYLYVFGLPYPNQSISYYIDLGIVLVKLQNVCPPDALRPRYQEGYLVGKFPMKPTKVEGDNLARRLVAKFELDNRSKKFWDKNFQPLPQDVLFPVDDQVEKELQKVKLAFARKSDAVIKGETSGRI